MTKPKFKSRPRRKASAEQIARRNETRAQRREQLRASVQPLLYERERSAIILACSLATVMRLEAKGLLDRVRLDPSNPNSKVRHRVEQVHALAAGKADA
jgi:hypothetical protein